MRTIVFGALGAIALSAFATAADAKCVRAGGQATAITHELARDLAKMALNTNISTWGGKAVGKTHYDCKYEFVFSTCSAKQRACK
jgi:hypothetical protein